mmetsp:Transcript_6569/g.27607  ORF Transcript_6569/g.27607 Transcript_6569/m.27607 type:complete len:545 (+) Transcript_6569:3024-4658(+)
MRRGRGVQIAAIALDPADDAVRVRRALVVAERGDARLQPAPRQGHRVVELALRAQDGGEVRHEGRDVGMRRSEGLLGDGDGALVQRSGGDVLAVVREGESQVVQAHGDVGVARPERPLSDRQRALEEGSRRRRLSKGSQDEAEPADGGREQRVMGSQGVFVDPGGARVRGPRLVVSAHSKQHHAEIVEIAGDGDVVAAEGVDVDRDGALEERARRGVVALRVVEQAQVVEPHREVGMIRVAQRFLANLDGALVEWSRGVVFALIAQQLGEIVHLHRDVVVLLAERVAQQRQRPLDVHLGFVVVPLIIETLADSVERAPEGRAPVAVRLLGELHERVVVRPRELVVLRRAGELVAEREPELLVESSDGVSRELGLGAHSSGIMLHGEQTGRRQEGLEVRQRVAQRRPRAGVVVEAPPRHIEKTGTRSTGPSHTLLGGVVMDDHLCCFVVGCLAKRPSRDGPAARQHLDDHDRPRPLVRRRRGVRHGAQLVGDGAAPRGDDGARLGRRVRGRAAEEPALEPSHARRRGGGGGTRGGNNVGVITCVL